MVQPGGQLTHHCAAVPVTGEVKVAQSEAGHQQAEGGEEEEQGMSGKHVCNCTGELSEKQGKLNLLHANHTNIKYFFQEDLHFLLKF